jgi:hypothetical protein
MLMRFLDRYTAAATAAMMARENPRNSSQAVLGQVAHRPRRRYLRCSGSVDDTNQKSLTSAQRTDSDAIRALRADEPGRRHGDHHHTDTHPPRPSTYKITHKNPKRTTNPGHAQRSATYDPTLHSAHRVPT